MDDRLVIRYIPLDKAVLWDKNPKLHDIGALTESFARYGFRDAPIFDETKGCIVAGHGRIKALTQMRNMGYPVPRGIYQSDDDWMVPIQFGINARTAGEAEAFAIDHNNITLLGGDLSLADISRIWDSELYIPVLEEIRAAGGEIISVDGDDLDNLLRQLESEGGSLDLGSFSEQTKGEAMFRVVVDGLSREEAIDLADTLENSRVEQYRVAA